jgi:enoyl-CoA hydratase
LYKFILVQQQDGVGLVTLNRPEVLNAWHAAMRAELHDALAAFENDAGVHAIVLTGSGEQAFSAGQDLNEAKTFDDRRAETWVDEWRRLYGLLRSLGKPLVCALNGVAAGSAFQVALLADIRVGHAGSRMGQPEINAGIVSTLGPWLMREMLGMSRTTELTLTGRLMSGEECHAIGLIHRLVAPEQVLPTALALARELANKPPVAMRLDKRRLAEMTAAGFEDALRAGVRYQRESYGSGEPQARMARFLAERAERKKAAREPPR